MTSTRYLLAALAAAPLMACGDGGGFPDAAPIDGPPPGGTFSLAYSVTDTGGAAVLCNQIGAQAVTATLRNPAVEGGFTEVFSCASGTSGGMGTSPAINPGTYKIDFELNGPAAPGGVLQTAPQQIVEVKSGQNTALAPVSFAVNATGGLAFTLNSNKPSGNCSTAADGAAITNMTITLARASDATCVPTTFAVSAGATGTATTYTSTCAAIAPTVPCLNADQQLSVSGLASGDYVLHVRGRTPVAGECYVNDDAIPVPALGMTTTRGLNIALATAAPGC